MSNILNPYLSIIKKAVDQDPKFTNLNYGTTSDEDYDLSYLKGLRSELHSLETLNESIDLVKGMNAPEIQNLSRLGSHPDFAHLKQTQETESHWILTGFVDVKKSTQLFNKFTKYTVALITEGIVKASIFAINLCGGYVHRIQGDGLMVYFGGKRIEKLQATKDALKAFSMISFFVKNDLKDFFEDKGISDIHTRAGLDLGHNNQVLWLYSGIGNAGEVTTCSLYTSLVPKMQAKAKSNGVVVGQNTVNQLSNKKYFQMKLRPIWDFEDGRTYNQFDFDWERYLVDNKLAVQNRYGDLVLNIGSTSSVLNPTYLEPIAKDSKPYFNLNE